MSNCYWCRKVIKHKQKYVKITLFIPGGTNFAHLKCQLKKDEDRRKWVGIKKVVYH